MFIITYPQDARFYENELVQQAQQTPEFRQLHDLLQVVCADARVQLVVRSDLVPWRTQAATRGAPALPANVTICVAVVRRLTPSIENKKRGTLCVQEPNMDQNVLRN